MPVARRCRHHTAARLPGRSKRGYPEGRAAAYREGTAAAQRRLSGRRAAFLTDRSKVQIFNEALWLRARMLRGCCVFRPQLVWTVIHIALEQALNRDCARTRCAFSKSSRFPNLMFCVSCAVMPTPELLLVRKEGSMVRLPTRKGEVQQHPVTNCFFFFGDVVVARCRPLLRALCLSGLQVGR